MDRPTRPTPAQSARAFLTPRRIAPTAPRPFMPEAERLSVEGPLGQLALRLEGDGPCVLLVHGWEGAPSDFSSFVPRLLDAGLAVLALDLPAHGDSAGEWMTIPLAAQALLAVQAQLASRVRVCGAIGHSLGAAILVHAMTLGFTVDRVALIASPAEAVDYARDYGERDGLAPDEIEHMLDIMHTDYAVDVRTISTPAQAATLSQRALFIHSDDDRVVPLAGSLATAAAWRGARHVTVSGLGHARLLRDEAVVEEVLHFLSSPDR